MRSRPGEYYRRLLCSGAPFGAAAADANPLLFCFFFTWRRRRQVEAHLAGLHLLAVRCPAYSYSTYRQMRAQQPEPRRGDALCWLATNYLPTSGLRPTTPGTLGVNTYVM